MSVDGKIQSLNLAVREAIPHLRGLARNTPFARMLIRAITFSDGARWHVEVPTPVDRFVWTDVTAYGETDLGEALRLVRSSLDSDSFSYALPPALVLVSDGLPTDDFSESLHDLLAHPLGAKTVRVAVGIGQDADTATLKDFMGSQSATPVRAHSPEALVSYLRQASTAALSSSISSVALFPLDAPQTEAVPNTAGRREGEPYVW